MPQIWLIFWPPNELPKTTLCRTYIFLFKYVFGRYYFFGSSASKKGNKNVKIFEKNYKFSKVIKYKNNDFEAFFFSYFLGLKIKLQKLNYIEFRFYS